MYDILSFHYLTFDKVREGPVPNFILDEGVLVEKVEAIVADAESLEYPSKILGKDDCFELAELMVEKPELRKGLAELFIEHSELRVLLLPLCDKLNLFEVTKRGHGLKKMEEQKQLDQLDA